MGKVYSGGVHIATGFSVKDGQPIADYMVVEEKGDLEVLDNRFTGMLVYVVGEEHYYFYNSNGVWIDLDPNPYRHQVIPEDKTVVLRGNETWRVFGQLTFDEEAGIHFGPGSALELI